MGLGLALGLVSTACRLNQRPSLKVVDPTLVAQGTALERERIRGGFSLGPYRVTQVGMRSEAPDLDGPLAQEEVARPVTQDRAGLVLEGAEGRTWTTTCRLQRRAPPAADYRAVLDENGDEIAVGCTAKTAGRPPWRFDARALLSGNFVGQLGPEGGSTETVEVLTRVLRFRGKIERVLPVPVAQLRRGDDAVVSVLLGRPERAWVDPSLDPVKLEAALALLLTLRFLPWELAQ
ncbi:MAG: hypothetical protein AAGF11_56190 [Myxococcota bacterium]